jgi:hypothetical protein
MAEPVALGIKPPTPISLGDMLNLARGAQAYQQAEQANPLALQKAQMEIEQLKKTNPIAAQKAALELSTLQQTQPSTITTATEQAKQAQIGTQKQQLDLDQSHFSLAGNILSGLETRAQSLAKKGDTATALKELKAAESWMNASGIPSKEGGATRQAEEQLKKGDFTGYLATLENMRNVLGGAASRYQSNLPQTATLGGAPATYTPATGVAKPLEIEEAKPLVSQPPPTTGVKQPQVGAPQVGAPQTGVTPTQMQLQYPVRKAGDIRPLAPNEAVDTEKGATYRNSLTTRQTDLSASRRNLDEVIKAATQIEKEDLFSSGVLGAATRTIKGMVGDPKYKQLSKDLANVQISNIQAQGGSMDTVAGQQLTKMANGDETYPPEVLINIARRTYSDLTNLDMQATGASKFAQKYGDSNLNTFKRMWSNNADSKVFEAMSIYENVKNPAKAKEEINKLLGSDPQQRQQFFNKYNNIKKLTATGEL